MADTKQAKPFNEIDPILLRLKKYLGNNNYSKKECSSELYNHYIDSDKTEINYYQRLNKLLNGEIFNLTDQEREAINIWINIRENIHIIGQVLYSINNIPAKLSELKRSIDSPYKDKNQLKRIIRELEKLNSLPIHKGNR